MVLPNLPPPPKRFQDPYDPVFDPIRHHKWFRRVGVRREKLPFLKAAYEQWKHHGNQSKASVECGINRRELLGYIQFIEGVPERPPELQKKLKKAIQDGYHLYCVGGGTVPFRKCLESIAHFHGLKPRHLVEAWETDPKLQP